MLLAVMVAVPLLLRMPPPTLVAELPVNVLPEMLRMALALFWKMAPPLDAELAESVLPPVTIRVPWLSTPPPKLLAKLPLRRLLAAMVAAPWFQMPPPLLPATFALMELPDTLRIFEFQIPPP